MAKIHYFQRYHTRENVVTNNTVHLLARLYQYRPSLLERLILTWFDGIQSDAVTVGPTFSQQVRKDGAVPDAIIDQKPFRIVVETKLYGQFDGTQNINHGKHFSNVGENLMLLLDKHRIAVEEVRLLEKVLSSDGNKNVHIHGLSFEELIRSIEDVLDDRDSEMQELVTDFEEFCSAEGILEDEKYFIRLLGSQYSLDLNLKYAAYYEDAARGFSRHSYIGLYSAKEVHAVGAIANVIVADLDGDTLTIHSATSTPTKEEEDRVKGIMKEAKVRAADAWDPLHNHRFILVENFYKTEFKKDSDGGMWGKRYLDLRKWVPKSSVNSAKQIAEALRGKSFA